MPKIIPPTQKKKVVSGVEKFLKAHDVCIYRGGANSAYRQVYINGERVITQLVGSHVLAWLNSVNHFKGTQPPKTISTMLKDRLLEVATETDTMPAAPLTLVEKTKALLEEVRQMTEASNPAD